MKAQGDKPHTALDESLDEVTGSEPAAASPRIRRDEVESKIPFIVENQTQGTLAGKALKDYRGWLWFKSAVMRKLIGGPKGVLHQYTREIGTVGRPPI